ncbi:hypothetical protein F1643_15615 [Azospirillum sp. INR13]|uniref:hypothetical protein n=1 Tax=Azospirillum sp. INR13 TaxID=2596919 RepID=UPI00189248E2|nr:hypothetical protein [Azospirillum sp. INR13]MBF5095647.1 hypothetical protein [Azospirillum sp. INR13]
MPDSLPPVTFGNGFQASLFVRMLFSCLTDADALATEAFSDPDMAAERGHARIRTRWRRRSTAIWRR